MLIYREQEKHENDGFPYPDFPFVYYTLNCEVMYHWHEHIELFYVAQGKFNVQVDGISYACEQGSLVFINSNSMHAYSPLSEVYQAYALVLGKGIFKDAYELGEEPVISTVFRNRITCPVLQLEAGNDRLREYIYSMMQEFHQKEKGYRTFIRATATALLTLLYRNCEFGNALFSENSQRLTKLIAFIEKNYAARITIEDAAREINVSPKYFCKLFKDFTGRTFTDYLAIIRVSKACELLAETELSVTEISYRTGFCNVNYFSRVFNKYMNTSALAFKKLYQANQASG